MQVDGKALPKEGLDKDAADRAVKALEQRFSSGKQPLRFAIFVLVLRPSANTALDHLSP